MKIALTFANIFLSVGLLATEEQKPLRDRTVRVHATDPEGYRIGRLKKGQVIRIFYLSGDWKAYPDWPRENPDIARIEQHRIALVLHERNGDTLIDTPQNTAKGGYHHVVDVQGEYFLRISDLVMDSNMGSCQYRVQLFSDIDDVPRATKSADVLVDEPDGGGKPTDEDQSSESSDDSQIDEVLAAFIDEAQVGEPLVVFEKYYADVAGWISAPLNVDTPPPIIQSVATIKRRVFEQAINLSPAERRHHRKAFECLTMIMSSYDKKAKMQSEVGLVVALNSTRHKLSNQALEARRNYLMSWPQYERENRQREVLLEFRNVSNEAQRARFNLSWTEYSIESRRKIESVFLVYLKEKASLSKETTK